MRLLKVSLLAGLAVAAGAVLAVQQAARAGRTPLEGSRSLGQARTFRNLTLFPVYDSRARSTTAYLTLDEGLKTRRVRVEEAKAGGEVNQLQITNETEQPLYIMGGEVVLGGQQDRCLGKDTIIPPGAKNIPVTVFCVEHGRWNGEGRFQETAKTVAGAGIRASAQEGAFLGDQVAAAGPAAGLPAISSPVPRPGAVNLQPEAQAQVGRQSDGQVAQQMAGEQVQGFGGGRAGREAPLSRAQTDVWEKVAAKNRKFDAAPATGTYRGVLNLADGRAKTSVAPYVEALTRTMPRDPQLVGVLVAIDGKVTAADIFGDPALFRNLWPKLLRSYAADAAEQEVEGSKAPVVTARQAREFLVAARNGKSQAESKSDVTSTLRLESEEAVSYRLMPAGQDGRRGAFSGKSPGGFGGALHENVIRK